MSDPIYRVKCNNVPREIMYDDEGGQYVTYRGSRYALSEFTVAPDSVKALGFDGVAVESAFSAVVIRFFGRDGEMIEDGDSAVIGYIHW